MSHGRLTAARITSLLAVLTAGVGTAAAAAAVGQWSGIMKAEGDLVRAVATRGKTMIQMSFGEPYNCRIPAELLDEDASTARYRFNPSSNGGGFCAGLYPGTAHVVMADDGLHVTFRHADRTWSGVLAGPAAK